MFCCYAGGCEHPRPSPFEEPLISKSVIFCTQLKYRSTILLNVSIDNLARVVLQLKGSYCVSYKSASGESNAHIFS